MKFKKIDPLISIIMNCHNGESYLKQSLKSVKSQSYKNWELIFYDNSSTDNSKSILKNTKDRRIKYYFSKKFLSLYDARNKAIKKSKGKYLAFLDVDDVWTKDKLKKQILFIKKDNNYKMIYSNYKILKENKSKITKYNKNLPVGSITQDLLKEYFINISTVLIEKKIFDKKKFNRFYSIIGDFAFSISVSKSINIGCVQKPLTIYRLHSNNFSSKNLNLYLKEMIYWYRKDGIKLKKEGYDLVNINFLIFKLFIKNILLSIKKFIN